jgi:hypothetical protein
MESRVASASGSNQQNILLEITANELYLVIPVRYYMLLPASMDSATTAGEL